MKNVKHMNEQIQGQGATTSTEPQWREEWVRLETIIQHGPFQVRSKLDNRAVKQYHDWTKAGREPPPIRLGLVKGRMYLVDGWHRMEAGALVTRLGPSQFGDDFSQVTGAQEVRALVADMTERQARWSAANANMGHGVPLKAGDYRNAFKAFIAAKGHINANGQYMSLREMGAVFGKGHTTVYYWVRKFCPAILAKLDSSDHGNFEGGTGAARLSLHEEHEQEASRLVQEVMQHARALESPVSRWGVLKALEEATEALRALGVEEPGPSDF